MIVTKRTSDTKFCVKCKHVDMMTCGDGSPFCVVLGDVAHEMVDVVSGIIVGPPPNRPRPASCQIMRGMYGACGLDAKLFEPHTT